MNTLPYSAAEAATAMHTAARLITARVDSLAEACLGAEPYAPYIDSLTQLVESSLQLFRFVHTCYTHASEEEEAADRKATLAEEQAKREAAENDSPWPTAAESPTIHELATK